MSVRNQPKIYEPNRRPKGRHPLFCFISFIGIYYPLTDIVIVHIVYINESTTTLTPRLCPFLISKSVINFCKTCFDINSNFIRIKYEYHYFNRNV